MFAWRMGGILLTPFLRISSSYFKLPANILWLPYTPAYRSLTPGAVFAERLRKFLAIELERMFCG
jgi:hypothetical protein